MQNEQCGICWNLKFDKQGKYTHKGITNFHNFVSLDYCLKCKEPKYDQWGLQTHQDEIHDFLFAQNSKISHEFISGIQAENQEKQKKKKNVITFVGIISLGVILTTSLSVFL